MKEFTNKTLPKGLTEEEFVRLIKVVPAKDKISKTIFLLGFGSGLRISEIVGAERKGDKPPIPPLTKDCFVENFIELRNAKGFKDRVVPKPKLWKEYMTNMLPIKLSVRTLQRRFEKYKVKAGLPDNYSFHSLRHGFALRCVEKGIPINQVQFLLGHSSLSTTNNYTKARPKDALEKYEELF